MITIRTWCKFFITSSILLAIGCSQSSAPTPTITARASDVEVPSADELLKMYDPTSLVEIRTLKGLPPDLRSVLGVQGTDDVWIADVGEPCDPTDKVGKEVPSRCFFVAGLSSSSALVAYKVGGFAGQWGIAGAYARTKSGWKKVGEWHIGYPTSLIELRGMTNLPPDKPEDYSQPAYSPFDAALRQ